MVTKVAKKVLFQMGLYRHDHNGQPPTERDRLNVVLSRSEAFDLIDLLTAQLRDANDSAIVVEWHGDMHRLEEGE